MKAERNMNHRRLKSATESQPGAASHTVNLERYVPAYLTWIANKLSRGASQRPDSHRARRLRRPASLAVLTPKGRHLHDQIMGMALDRERAFLSVLDEDEVEVLLGLMRRLHANLPAVEVSTQNYVRARFPKAAAGLRPDDDETP